MALSTASRDNINKMCPAAEAASLGTEVYNALASLGIAASDTTIVVADGTDSIVIGEADATGTPTIVINGDTDACTISIGTVAGHTVNVGTGTAAVTSLGSTTSGNTSVLSDGTITIGHTTATTSVTIISAGAVDVGKSGQMTTVKGTLNVDEAVTFDSTQSSALTETSATPSTTRLVRSELTLTPATSLAVSGSGSLAAVRGCVTLTTGKECTDGYLYGVQGKFVGDGATLSVGSGHVAGVLAQMSGSSMTVTDGHVGVIVASGQSLPASANVSMIYCESGGNAIQSVISSSVKATYFLDINNFESAGICSSSGTPGSVTGATGWIKVYVDGAVRYIPLTDSVS